MGQRVSSAEKRGARLLFSQPFFSLSWSEIMFQMENEDNWLSAELKIKKLPGLNFWTRGDMSVNL